MTSFKKCKQGKYWTYRCLLCQSAKIAAIRKKRKERLVKDFGGKCTRCGYDRYVGALQFHHKDKENKKFGIAATGVGYTKLYEEAKKCELVCANCHAEIEGGISI